MPPHHYVPYPLDYISSLGRPHSNQLANQGQYDNLWAAKKELHLISVVFETIKRLTFSVSFLISIQFYGFLADVW